MDEAIARLQAAFDQVKDLPEFKPYECARWLELRQAAETVLESRSKS